jgi:hypothetical protein
MEEMDAEMLVFCGSYCTEATKLAKDESLNTTERKELGRSGKFEHVL